MTLELKVYSCMQAGYKVFSVEKTDNGWKIIPPLRTTFEDCNCDKQGNPILFDRLNHESIHYPQYLGEYMEYLWGQATEENMTDGKIQEHLNELGIWISAVERSSPVGEFWSKFDY